MILSVQIFYSNIFSIYAKYLMFSVYMVYNMQCTVIVQTLSMNFGILQTCYKIIMKINKHVEYVMLFFCVKLFENIFLLSVKYSEYSLIQGLPLSPTLQCTVIVQALSMIFAILKICYQIFMKCMLIYENQ